MSFQRLLMLFLSLLLLGFTVGCGPFWVDPCTHCTKVCITNQDGKKQCVECETDNDCVSGYKTVCVKNKCSDCKPGDTRSCTSEKICHSGKQTCNPKGQWGECKDGVTCTDGFYCRNKVCVEPSVTCKSNEANCNNRCVDLQSNQHNCGRCGVMCEPGYTCDAGKCRDLGCFRDEDCKAGELCGGDQLCKACKKEDCVVGAIRCKEQLVQRCHVINGCKVWKFEKSCVAPSVCQDGGGCLLKCSRDSDCLQNHQCRQGFCRNELWAKALHSTNNLRLSGSISTTASEHLVWGTLLGTGNDETVDFPMSDGKAQTFARKKNQSSSFATFLALQQKNGLFRWVRGFSDSAIVFQHVAASKTDDFCVSGVLYKDTTLLAVDGEKQVKKPMGAFFPIILQYNAKGLVKWFSILPQAYIQTTTELKQGGCVVAGKDLKNKVFIMAFDSKGKQLWKQSPALSDKPPIIRSSTTTPSGKIAILFSGPLVLLYKPDGSLEWMYRTKILQLGTPVYGVIKETSYAQILSNQKDELFVVMTVSHDGGRPSLVTKAGTLSAEASDYLVLKIAQGELLSGKILKSGLSGGHLRAAFDSQDNLYLIGDYNKIELLVKGKKIQLFENRGVFFAKMDSSGNYLWVKNTAGFLNSLSVSALSVGQNGELYFVGAFHRKPLSLGNVRLLPRHEKGSTGFLCRMHTDGTLP